MAIWNNRWAPAFCWISGPLFCNNFTLPEGFGATSLAVSVLPALVCGFVFLERWVLFEDKSLLFEPSGFSPFSSLFTLLFFFRPLPERLELFWLWFWGLWLEPLELMIFEFEPLGDGWTEVFESVLNRWIGFVAGLVLARLLSSVMLTSDVFAVLVRTASIKLRASLNFLLGSDENRLCCPLFGSNLLNSFRLWSLCWKLFSCRLLNRSLFDFYKINVIKCKKF